MISWLKQEPYTLIGLLMAGMVYDKTDHAAAMANDLTKIVVRTTDLEEPRE